MSRINGYSVAHLRVLAEQRRRALEQERAKLRRVVSNASRRLDVIDDELRQLEATKDLISY